MADTIIDPILDWIHVQDAYNLEALSLLPYYDAISENLSRDNISNYINTQIIPRHNLSIASQTSPSFGHYYANMNISGGAFVQNGTMSGTLYHTPHFHNDNSMGDVTNNYGNRYVNHTVIQNNYEKLMPYFIAGIIIVFIFASTIIVLSILQWNRETQMLEELVQSRRSIEKILSEILDAKKFLLNNLSELKKDQIINSSNIEHINIMDLINPILNNIVTTSSIYGFYTNIFLILIVVIFSQLLFVYFYYIITYIKMIIIKIFLYIIHLYTNIYIYLL